MYRLIQSLRIHTNDQSVNRLLWRHYISCGASANGAKTYRTLARRGRHDDTGPKGWRRRPTTAVNKKWALKIRAHNFPHLFLLLFPGGVKQSVSVPFVLLLHVIAGDVMVRHRSVRLLRYTIDDRSVESNDDRLNRSRSRFFANSTKFRASKAQQFQQTRSNTSTPLKFHEYYSLQRLRLFLPISLSFPSLWRPSIRVPFLYRSPLWLTITCQPGNASKGNVAFSTTDTVILDPRQRDLASSPPSCWNYVSPQSSLRISVMNSLLN